MGDSLQRTSMEGGNRRVNDQLTHIIVLPFPVQGHINPMHQFSKRLASKGLKVTLITTTPTNKYSTSINTEQIPVALWGEEESIDAYLERFRLIVSRNLAGIIEKYTGSKFPVLVLVYDSVMSWVQEIAERLGVHGAPFFTQSCAVSTIYYHVHQGELRIPVEGRSVCLPSLPTLGVDDLPSFVNDTSSYPALWRLVASQFANLERVSWIFFNTFSELEDEVVKWLATKRPIKTIGPTIPSIYLDRRLDDDRDYGLSLFKPNGDACITWLDTKDCDSVIYVSFGSLASLGEEQMEELAWGLKSSNSYFLWVVRELEKKKLPKNYEEETSEKGLVVSWCPQLQVLAHKAVGCFLTHCGWNSTLEALSLGVPMVGMPQWTDQTTNAKFVQDVWGVGVRVKVGENGIVGRDEIEECIKEVMVGEKGNEMKRNAQRWKELAKEAVNEGGSSDNNIEEFVAQLVCR